jgi:hypothetical protein
MLDGGYMLPEYGVAYIKHVRFFRKQSKKERLTDLIVAACKYSKRFVCEEMNLEEYVDWIFYIGYDLSNNGEGLYEPPSRHNLEQIRSRTLEKFQAMIASAVANTEGDGRDTYLLLGPIGTGAFANDKKMIAELFSQVLNNPLMDSNGAIRYAFDQIWFVSTNNLQIFEEVFQEI